MSDTGNRNVATRVLSRGTHLVRSRLRLTVAPGTPQAEETEFTTDVIRIGADTSCDLVLGDDSVSSRHAELALTGEGLIVRDLGSTNGTFVNGVRVREAFLEPGARLQVGETQIALERTGEVQVPLSGSLRFGRLLGQSAAMREVFALLEKAAPTDKTVLIEGETGTGKDVCAGSIHDESPRSEGPFIVFDCGAASPTLIESELFGHAKGAFTGAGDARQGVFERASGGTVFLDEIGELPLELQPKLLRVLEERAVRRLGDGRRIDVDVRLIAATNRNLKNEVTAGTFRRDLYFRLNVIRVVMPPLRKRLDDLPLLSQAILSEEPGEPRLLRPETLEMLAAYPWPGNVRELRNVLSRAATFATREIEPSHLPGFENDELPGHGGGFEVESHLPYHAAKERCLDRFERTYVEAILDASGGNVSRAAEQSGIPRQTIHRLMSKHGIRSKTRSA